MGIGIWMFWEGGGLVRWIAGSAWEGCIVSIGFEVEGFEHSELGGVSLGLGEKGPGARWLR
jgi:hypothetical protein